MDFEGRTFSSETVAIDGKRFVSCTFENVTFAYSGGEFFFDRCTFRNFPQWTFHGDLLRGLANLAEFYRAAGQTEALIANLGALIRSAG